MASRMYCEVRISSKTPLTQIEISPTGNPQRYYNDPKARTSDFWVTFDEPEATKKKVSHSDPLAAFTSGHHLAETEPSSHVSTSLKLYALNFHLPYRSLDF